MEYFELADKYFEKFKKKYESIKALEQRRNLRLFAKLNDDKKRSKLFVMAK